jgi:UDP-galactopyranose mutase
LAITEKKVSAGESLDFTNFDVLVVGSGYAGSVIAREFATRNGSRVAVVEQRPHIGGNSFDEYDEYGVLVHRYGPHIFHSESERVYQYLSRFTSWRDYQHVVLADIHGKYTPVPFNLNSIEQHFPPDQASAIISRLLECFGADAKVPIIELRKMQDLDLLALADFVYENVFLHYTEKQWGLSPEQIDPAVTARVPVFVGRDNRYFQDRFQGMPLDGYTAMFEQILDHPLITCYLGLDARDILSFVGESASPDSAFSKILVNGQSFDGEVIYTGALDLLCDCRFGLLPYRSLDFVYKHFLQEHVLPCGTVNYTVSEDYTRISEYSWMTGQQLDHSTIMEEYPRPFLDPVGQIPYYAIINDSNYQSYQRYLSLFSAIPNFHALGRLAEYRYYNMDQIVLRALELADSICAQV